MTDLSYLVIANVVKQSLKTAAVDLSGLLTNDRINKKTDNQPSNNSHCERSEAIFFAVQSKDCFSCTFSAPSQ